MAGVCRTCLTFSTRMHDLQDTQLRETFEIITSKRLSTRLGVTLICYLCYAQLKKCHRFAEMSWKSEVILTELVNKGVDITQELITRLGWTSRTSTYSFTPVDYFYNGFKEPPEVVVKEDAPLTEYQVVVKEENLQTEECEFQSLVEVKKEPVLKEELVFKEEPVFIEEETVIKEEFEELWMDEDIDIEGEVTLYENCELISKSEETMPYEEEFVDIELVSGKENLPISNISKDTTKEQELQYICAICTKILNTKGNLKRHMRIHARKIYICDFCDRSFNSRHVIKKHIKTHSVEKPHTCQLCDKTFRQKRYLREHVRMHAKHRPYICHSCGKAFTDKSTLNRHIATHNGIKSGIKAVVCNICNKKFNRNEHLIIHMRIHTKLKPYTCRVCDHSFTQKCSLTVHMRTHTGERRHYCSQCNKSFQRRGHVQQHMSVHTGERPFQCNDCDKRFSTKRYLIQHPCKPWTHLK